MVDLHQRDGPVGSETVPMLTYSESEVEFFLILLKILNTRPGMTPQLQPNLRRKLSFCRFNILDMLSFI